MSPLERYDLLITRAEIGVSNLRQLQGRIESRQRTEDRACLAELIRGRIDYAESKIQNLVQERREIVRRLP